MARKGLKRKSRQVKKKVRRTARRVSRAVKATVKRASPKRARQPRRKVRLVELAHARSGDKGDTANIGLIALRPEYYPLLAKQVTASRVSRHFRGLIDGPVERYELPNLNALNFLLHGALGGGGTLSLKTDAQGKVFSTALLRMEITVPKEFRVR